MALAVGQSRRPRSSTGASRTLNNEESGTDTAELIGKLSLETDGHAVSEGALSQLADAVTSLREKFADDALSKDIFRRGRGFDAALKLFETLADSSLQRSAQVNELRASIIVLISEGIDDHRGNAKYFSSHLDGWHVMQDVLSAMLTPLLDQDGDISGEALASLLTPMLSALLESSVGEGWKKLVPNEDKSEDDAESEAAVDCVLQNPDACAIAVRLLMQLDVDASSLTTHFTRVIETLVLASNRNKVGFWSTGILSDLLKFEPEDSKATSVAPMVSTLIDEMADLGINSLDDVALLFQQGCDSDDARRLLLQSSQQSKGPAFIQFDLSLCGYSSIEFPSLPRPFPPTSGYSFSMWLRIDNFDANCHTTLFGAFDASQTCFILMYLEKDSHQLILQTSIRSSRPSVRFKSTRFDADKWYHLALVHRKNGKDARQSSAALFVNGEFAEQVKCSYPDSPPGQEISTRSPSGPSTQATRHQRPVQAFFGTPHDLGLKFGRGEVKSQWSVSSAHLYQSPLSDEFIAVHYRLGPRYTGNFQDCLGPLLTYRASAELNRYNELLHPDKSDKSDIVTATENRGSDVVPESRLLISICPTAVISFDGPDNKHQRVKYELDRKAQPRYVMLSQTSKAIAINAAVPTLSEAISRSYGTGILTGDPVVAVPKSLDDATWCLTGSLPLLARLLEAARTKTAFLQSVQIFFECVKDNWRISEAMEKGNGFGVLAALTREKLGIESGAPAATARKSSPVLSLDDRQSLPIELLELILDFVGYDKARPENSMIVNPMAYRVLLVDFNTWRRCDLATQKLYFTQFAHFVTHNKHQSFNQKRLVRMRVIRRLIEALKAEEFSSEIVPFVMEAIRALLDHSSAASMYRELAMFVAYGLQDERSAALRSAKSMASVVNLRQRAGAWARAVSGSRPSTPLTPGGARNSGVSRAELALCVLELLASILCRERSSSAIRRFDRAIPNRWLLHLLAEPDVRAISLTVRIVCRSLAALGSDFKTAFVDKNGGFTTLRNRLKVFWKSPEVWTSCFAILFGTEPPEEDSADGFSVFKLVGMFCSGKDLTIVNPEILSTIMAMLETGLRHAVKLDEPEESDVKVLKTVIQFLNELYSRSANFREFCVSSRYVQEILFVLYPVLVGSDRLSSETELQADKDSLSFRGEEVKMRPHSNSLGERPPSVRSLNVHDDKASDRRTPSPRAPFRVDAPRRLSSFVLVSSEPTDRNVSPAQFNPIMSPKKAEPPKMNVGNSIVESLLEVAVNLFVDQVCNKDKFNGIGLFLKVPPGFREHQAYFESYVLVHTLTQLWNHLQLEQALLVDTRVLTNLSRYCQHMSEAVFEGWFINGAQPLLDFTGKLLEYLQQEDVASVKGVRLCSQHVNTMRVVFLRVCLWRLAELDESVDEVEATGFLDQMNYWQTILFSTENQETLFVRLICYLLYMKLVSEVQSVRLAAARLWRTILVQKPTESATLLAFAMGSEQRHLSTGFMKLVSVDDEEFITWIDENRPGLDTVFIDALNKPWNDFVSDENRRTEESAKNRLSRRREKLRQWQAEESNVDDFMHRYEVSTNHWRSNVHAQERLKLQRSIQDHQENVAHLVTVFAGLEKQVKQPCGIDPASDDPKWQLDETESINRMRMRTVRDAGEQTQPYQPKRKMSERRPHGRLTVDTHVDRAAVGDNIMSAMPESPLPGGSGVDGINDEAAAKGRSRGDSISNSQLLEGGFEMVEDPREADDGLIEDKNRKVMTSLQRGDVVQQLHNVSRIVGLEACEGLLVVGKKCLYLQDNFFQRSDGEIVSVSQAPDDERDPYVQLISGKDVGSQRTKHSLGDQEGRHWTWAEVLSVSKRRFLFRDVSIEAFFTDGRSYLLTCMSSKTRDDLYNAIVHRAPHVHGSSSLASEDAWRLDTLRNPEEAPQTLGSKFASVFNSMPSHAATKKWSRGDMSNFQYLMLVNTMAGRTFNDLTQYPVFPWVIADYDSEELDLDDPKSFRDLSKPMGCQSEGRENEFKDRYRQFAEMGDDNAPPFHYGTHYSSAMIVSSYLIRLQPFVQSYLLLQGGSFDHADRLFDSIEKAWLSSSRDNMTDVRELTPEFFYLPEFLLNINKYDFGAKQGTGEVVSDVKLPRWAKGDPHIFVQKHREALESPYVSANLHQWVDLVFGHKQRGEAAVEATNVFQHLSYQGAKDLDTIDDPVERLASIGIIHSFGQTPHQVFQKPHPLRERDSPATRRLDSLAETLTRLPEHLFESDERVAGLTFSHTHERLLCAGPCKLNILPACDRYLQWGFADHSLRFFSANTKRLLGLHENAHVGPITTATFADSRTLVTASTDCTIGLWNLSAARDAIDIHPRTYLFGHRAPVVLLAASRVFSTLLSASSDGHVLLWGLNRQQCIRALHAPGSAPVQAARISNVSGHVLVCQGAEVLLYTLNGHLLLRQHVSESRLTSCAFYEGSGNEWMGRELVFTGHANGVANVWALTTRADGTWGLELVKRLSHAGVGRGDAAGSAVTCILPMALAVYTGDEEGRVWEWDCVVRQGSMGAGGRR